MGGTYRCFDAIGRTMFLNVFDRIVPSVQFGWSGLSVPPAPGTGGWVTPVIRLVAIDWMSDRGCGFRPGGRWTTTTRLRAAEDAAGDPFGVFAVTIEIRRRRCP